jgi:hypothetical protein
LSWTTRFEDPLPDIVTLRDAATYMQKLPKPQQTLQHWQTAVEMLIKAAEGSPAWLMMARIAMLRAMSHGKPRVVFSNRKEAHCGKRKLKRDEQIRGARSRHPNNQTASHRTSCRLGTPTV